jgi:hypothetical protein
LFVFFYIVIFIIIKSYIIMYLLWNISILFESCSKTFIYLSPKCIFHRAHGGEKEMKTTAAVLGAFLAIALFAGMTAALNPLQGDDWQYDPDNDGLTNRDEFIAGSDPNNWDTDGDSLPDGWEVENSLDPADPSDALLDNDYFGGEEFASYSQVEPPYTNVAEYYRSYGIDEKTGEELYAPTDPNNPDTDGDGILDPDDSYPWDYIPGEENGGKGNPTPPQPNPGPPGPPPKDSDGDGLPDEYEMSIGTDYLNPDTDGDGLLDPMELTLGQDPNDWDTDNDMLIDGVEMGSGYSTDGHYVDTDNDGTSGQGNGGGDKSNPNPNPYDPRFKDSDGDGLLDGEEWDIGTDYLNPDTDGDGRLDPQELSLGLDPNDWDTDNDMLIDGVEDGGDGSYSTDGHLSDTDNDGIA